MSPIDNSFDANIFINCPFDKEYRPLLDSLLFTIIKCGFNPRIASERSDSAEIRLNKIKELIKQSRYSIHDISRMEPLNDGDLPRFNMPFELGLDFACRDFGNRKLSKKKYLILERQRYHYKKVLSDIDGNDIKAHNNNPQKLIREVRNWLLTNTDVQTLSAPTRIWQEHNEFYSNFLISSAEQGFNADDIEEMPVIEFIEFIKDWVS